VQVEGHTAHLLLVTNGPDGSVHEDTDIPLSHAVTLLELAHGWVDYLAIRLNIGTQTANMHRFTSPGLLDVITVAFEHNEQARRFQPLPWFSPEVTSEPRYQTRSIAMTGLLPFVRLRQPTQPSRACLMPWTTALDDSLSLPESGN